MLWAWPDDVASTASTQSNLLSRTPPSFPFPFPLHVADNHSKLHKCMANKCEASERSSRKPPGAARHCRCQSRCRCWASILASTHHVRFGALGLDTHSHTHTHKHSRLQLQIKATSLGIQMQTASSEKACHAPEPRYTLGISLGCFRLEFQPL